MSACPQAVFLKCVHMRVCVWQILFSALCLYMCASVRWPTFLLSAKVSQNTSLALLESGTFCLGECGQDPPSLVERSSMSHMANNQLQTFPQYSLFLHIGITCSNFFFNTFIISCSKKFVFRLQAGVYTCVYAEAWRANRIAALDILKFGARTAYKNRINFCHRCWQKYRKGYKIYVARYLKCHKNTECCYFSEWEHFIETLVLCDSCSDSKWIVLWIESMNVHHIE